MSLSIQLQGRSKNRCELCDNPSEILTSYTIPPETGDTDYDRVVLCTSCFTKILENNFDNPHYWRFLEGSLWSETPSVQVLSYKILAKLSSEQWAADALEGALLDEELISRAGAEEALHASRIVHKDAYGTELESGDTVVLTQNLNVKGTNYIAPKGTIVRKIKLVNDNEEQIEGRINNDTIVILTRYVKKAIS